MRLADILARPLLIYGIGNVGRQDDGLGPLLVERLEAIGVPEGVTLDSGYQLVPEDALVLSSQHTVLFVDASTAPGAPCPYSVTPVSPAYEVSFSTHAMSMGAVLTLCGRMYGRAPLAYALAIPGYRFEVNAGVSAEAGSNLDGAVHDLLTALRLTARRRPG